MKHQGTLPKEGQETVMELWMECARSEKVKATLYLSVGGFACPSRNVVTIARAPERDHRGIDRGKVLLAMCRLYELSRNVRSSCLETQKSRLVVCLRWLCFGVVVLAKK